MGHLRSILITLIASVCFAGPAMTTEQHAAMQQKVCVLVRDEVLLRNPGYDTEGVSVSILYMPRELTLVSSSATISVKVPAQIRTVKGKLVVPVYAGGEKHNVIAQVHLTGKVLIATKPIQKYEIISDDAIVERQIDLSSVPDSYVSRRDNVIGREAMSSISADTVILQRMIGQPTTGRKGGKVNIVAKVNNVTVKCTGTLLQDAVQGAAVWVENEKSGARVQGTLVSDDTVVVCE